MIYINGRFLSQKLTGVQRFAYELSVRLCKLNDNITILVPNSGAIKNDYLIADLPVKELCGGNGHFWEQVTLPYFIKKDNSNVLVNLCNTGPVFISNQIVSLHDITYIRHPSSFSRAFRFFYCFLIPLLIKRSRLVVTVSEFSRDEISKFYNIDKNKIHVISNAVDNKFYTKKTNLNKSEEYFLTVSSVSHHKNISGLVNAILSSDLKVTLKIIGEQSPSFNFVNIDTNDSRILFLGRVTDEQLISLYQGAKAFVFPSFYEGFGIPVLEAQSCQCPVVSSNRASMPEILNDSALFFDPESHVEIIKAISIVNDMPDVRRVLVEQGLLNIQRFSWDESARKMALLINSISEI